MCVMTGDYRMLTSGPYDTAMDGMRLLRAAIAAPVNAVLGNHDFIEMSADLEEMGVRMLINESVAIERAGERIWIAGVDDAHFYEADDIDRAAQGVPKGACSILLSHSPEVYKHAAACGFALMLCGHTHGGQICLPGGAMILKNSRCPRRFCRGAWQHESMAGYTSRGTGTSGIPVRFNSPAEIVVHHLTRV
jgi:predicted MPP superfamily phosphohydrolase